MEIVMDMDADVDTNTDTDITWKRTQIENLTVDAILSADFEDTASMKRLFPSKLRSDMSLLM
jgi:hypothetical protein